MSTVLPREFMWSLAVCVETLCGATPVAETKTFTNVFLNESEKPVANAAATLFEGSLKN